MAVIRASRLPPLHSRRSLPFLLVIFIIGTGISAAENVSDLVFQGAEHHYAGRLDLAVSTFESAVRIDPMHAYAHNQLGVLYAKQGRFDKAFDEFSVVTAMDPLNTFSRMWLGILHLRQGNLEIAETKFKEIIQLDLHHADAYYFLGVIHNFMHNPETAIHFLTKAKEADSQEADTHFRLAKAFHHLDMTANAMIEYQRAIDLKPTHTRAINELGWVHYNRGDYNRAFAAWKKTLSINKKDREALSNLAKGYNDLAWKAHSSGKKSEAIRYWKETLKINPSNKAAEYYLQAYGP